MIKVTKKILEDQVNKYWDIEKEQIYTHNLLSGNILDVGAGTGYYSLKLVNTFNDISHIDCIEKDLSLGSLSIYNKKVSMYLDDFFNVDIKENYYDFCIMRFFLQHMKDPEQAIINGLLKLNNSGKLIIIDSDSRYDSEIFPEDEYSKYYQQIVRQQTNDIPSRNIGRSMVYYIQNTHSIIEKSGSIYYYENAYANGKKYVITNVIFWSIISKSNGKLYYDL